MGIDNDAKLVVGWFLDSNKIRERLDGLTTCEDCLRKIECPEGWQIVSSSPFFDSPSEYHTIAVSAVIPESQGESSAPGSALLQILSDETFLETGLKFALTLGANERPVQVMALPHIW